MNIAVSREAVCLADDQLEPLELALEIGAEATSVDELNAILREEVYPACACNLREVAGEWADFEADWLEQRILRDRPPPRPWWRRLQRYLTLGWSVPVCLPEGWN